MRDLKIGVVYLAWLPYGIAHFERFLASYLQFSSGYPHQLIIAFNGQPQSERDSPERYIELLHRSLVRDFSEVYFEKGQDVYVYKQIATRCGHDFFLFLNTYSVILCENWLLHFVQNQNEGVGLLGATGSYAGYVTSINRDTLTKLKGKGSWKSKMGLIKYALKLNLFYGARFKAFPNAHIRTTGFFISKKLLIEIHLPGELTKMDAYLFENGRQSLTNQILKRSLKCLVVDRCGMGWNVEGWKNSNTFWINRQEGLMIADNQTRKYMEASIKERESLTKDAWGT